MLIFKAQYIIITIAHQPGCRRPARYTLLHVTQLSEDFHVMVLAHKGARKLCLWVLIPENCLISMKIWHDHFVIILGKKVYLLHSTLILSQLVKGLDAFRHKNLARKTSFFELRKCCSEPYKFLSTARNKSGPLFARCTMRYGVHQLYGGLPRAQKIKAFLVTNV